MPMFSELPSFKTFKALSDKVNRLGVAALSSQERAFYAIYLFEFEMYNGGAHQYFFNSSGDFANELVSGFLAIEAPRSAKIAQELVSLFPNGTPDPNRLKRDAQLREIEGRLGEKELWDILRPLDKEHCQDYEGLDGLLVRFAQKHGFFVP